MVRIRYMSLENIEVALYKCFHLISNPNFYNTLSPTHDRLKGPSCIQSHSPLPICLIAVEGNQSAQRKPTLKGRGQIPIHTQLYVTSDMYSAYEMQ